MRIGIDATNIRSGGGLTHLRELLNSTYVQQQLSNVYVEVWGGASLTCVHEAEHLKVKMYKAVDQGRAATAYWRMTRLPELAKSVDLVFAPGGLYALGGTPYVSMSQNMLVFQEEERNRFPFGLNWLRYNLLERLQLRSFRRSAGVLYISEFARSYIKNKYPDLGGKKDKVVYHGISQRFRKPPAPVPPAGEVTFLYVSIINFYKHQWNVVEAIERLNQDGFSCHLRLIGPANPKALPRLEEALATTEHTTYEGAVPFEEIEQAYQRADAFIFASSCENMPNILVEAMSAGLPVFSAAKGPMPEVLQEGGAYFDPLDVSSICAALRPYLAGEKEWSGLAERSSRLSAAFSWEKCARETFDFLKSCSR